MAANKSKKQFQGKNRRFRGDVWLDEKVSGRTMHALQERGVKFPPGTNVRGTREFKCNVTRSVSKMTEIERRGGKRWDKPKKAGKSRDCRGGKF